MYRTIIQRAQHIASLHRDHRYTERDTAAIQLARDILAHIPPSYPMPTGGTTPPPCALPGHTPHRLWHTTGN